MAEDRPCSALGAQSTDLSEKVDSAVSDVLPEVKSHTALLSAASTAAGGNGRSSKIHDAAWQGDVELLRSCLDDGFSPNAADADGNTPLHLAAAQGQSVVVDALLAARADPRLPNRAGQVPLDVVAQDTPAWRALRGHLTHLEHLARPHGCFVRFRGERIYYGAKGNRELQCWFDPQTCQIHFKLPAPTGVGSRMRRALTCWAGRTPEPDAVHRSMTLPYTTAMHAKHACALEVDLDEPDEVLHGEGRGAEGGVEVRDDADVKGVTINMCLAEELQAGVAKMVRIFHSEVLELRQRLVECEAADGAVAAEVAALEADMAARRRQLTGLIRHATRAKQEQARTMRDALAGLQAKVVALRRQSMGRRGQVMVLAVKAIDKLKSRLDGARPSGAAEDRHSAEVERAAAAAQLPVLEAYLAMAATKWNIPDPAASLAAATSPPPRGAASKSPSRLAVVGSPSSAGASLDDTPDSRDSLNFFCLPPPSASPGPSPLGARRVGAREELAARESSSSSFAHTLRQWAAASRGGPPPRPIDSPGSATASTARRLLADSLDTGSMDLDGVRLLVASSELTPNSKRRPFVRHGAVPSLDLASMQPESSQEYDTTQDTTGACGQGESPEVASYQIPAMDASLCSATGSQQQPGREANDSNSAAVSPAVGNAFASPGSDKSLTSTVFLAEKHVPPNELFASAPRGEETFVAAPSPRRENREVRKREPLPRKQTPRKTSTSNGHVRRAVERLSSMTPSPPPKRADFSEQPTRSVSPRRVAHSTSISGPRCSITAKCDARPKGSPAKSNGVRTSNAEGGSPIARYPSRYVSGPGASQYKSTSKPGSSACFHHGIAPVAVAMDAGAKQALAKQQSIGGDRDRRASGNDARMQRWRS